MERLRLTPLPGLVIAPEVTWSGPFLLYTYEVGEESVPALMSWDSRTQRRSVLERPGLDRFVLGPISAPRCDSAAV